MVWKRLLQYPEQALFLGLVAVCLGGILVLGGFAWRSLGELREMAVQERQTERLQVAGELLQRLAAEGIASGRPPDPATLEALRKELSDLERRGPALHHATAARLAEVEKALAAPEAVAATTIETLALELQAIVGDKENAERTLVRTLRVDALAELETAILVFLALAALGLAGGWLMHRRILRPLRDLQAMFIELSRREFSSIPVAGVHPVLVPLFENYNSLVKRLEDLEREHHSHAAHLESEVRAATEALLDQQRTLARADRLAAVGELAAQLAHEIRNPLAGAHVALTNLRKDLGDPDLAIRLDLALAELERLSRLLNQQLSAARHVPEPLRQVDMRALVDELVALLRYQVPAHIRLQAEVAPTIRCALPRDRLRQALLNLILNAVQALGSTPGSVSIRGDCQDARLRIDVVDDGPGFPAELLQDGPRAFVTRRPGGTGMGLAMVRRLAVDLGGELRLENRDDGGAAALLTLPCTHA